MSRNTTNELDIYAAEFARLVDRYVPSRRNTPSEWLGRLPDEVYQYYRRGASTFGADARTPVERRGRLYLLHTAVLFMWMSWGKETARERFQQRANKGTCRAASLVTLECYRRAGVLAHYETADWFFQPVEAWSVTLTDEAIESGGDGDPALRETLRDQSPADCTVRTFSRLRDNGWIPERGAISV